MSVERYGPSCEPAGPLMMGNVSLGTTPEPTHADCPGGESKPGLIGGWSCPCECHRKPAPGVLWKQADEEWPDDADRRRARYLDLMREHGHLIPAEPGIDHNLPCGWPGERRA